MGFVDYPGNPPDHHHAARGGDPLDRYVQFEEPLGRAPGGTGHHAGGGGSLPEAGSRRDGDPGEVDIGVVVKDVGPRLGHHPRGPQDAGARPKETRIRQREPVEKDYPLDG